MSIDEPLLLVHLKNGVCPLIEVTFFIGSPPCKDGTELFFHDSTDAYGSYHQLRSKETMPYIYMILSSIRIVKLNWRISNYYWSKQLQVLHGFLFICSVLE